MSDMTAPPDPVQPAQTQAQADLAGYPSVEELAKGYRASSTEAQKWRDYANQLERQQTQAPAPTNSERRNAADRLRDLGFPTDDLDELINERVNQRIEPMVRSFSARNELVAQYGQDYQKFEADVYRYVQSDPEVLQTFQRLAQADSKGALDYAYLKYGAQQSRNGTPPGIEAAQAQASLPASRTGGSDTRGEPDLDSMRVELRQKFLETRDSRYLDALKKVAFKQAIPDEFFTR